MKSYVSSEWVLDVIKVLGTCIFDWAFIQTLTSFWSYLGHSSVIPYWLIHLSGFRGWLSSNFQFLCDWLLIPPDFWISGQRHMITRLLSKINIKFIIFHTFSSWFRLNTVKPVYKYSALRPFLLSPLKMKNYQYIRKLQKASLTEKWPNFTISVYKGR